jgi:hypothetical protein
MFLKGHSSVKKIPSLLERPANDKPLSKRRLGAKKLRSERGYFLDKGRYLQTYIYAFERAHQGRLPVQGAVQVMEARDHERHKPRPSADINPGDDDVVRNDGDAEHVPVRGTRSGESGIACKLCCCLKRQENLALRHWPSHIIRMPPPGGQPAGRGTMIENNPDGDQCKGKSDEELIQKAGNMRQLCVGKI